MQFKFRQIQQSIYVKIKHVKRNLYFEPKHVQLFFVAYGDIFPNSVPFPTHSLIIMFEALAALSSVFIFRSFFILFLSIINLF